VTHTLFIYAISDVKQENKGTETVYSYKIHFCSPERLLQETVGIRQAYTNSLISDNVRDVHQNYLNNFNKTIEVENTKGPQDIVVPNFSPIDTMYFFSRRATAVTDSSTQTFRFFENRRGYHFVTHDHLYLLHDRRSPAEVKKYLSFGQNNYADQSPEGQQVLMNNIMELDFGNHVNTLKDIQEGAYYRKTTELNYLERHWSETNYQHLNEYQKYLLPDGTGETRVKHQKDFVEQYMQDARDRIVLKDYPSLGRGETSVDLRRHAYYPEVYNDKQSNLYHHINEQVVMQVYGRTKLCAGDIVAISIRKPTSNPKEWEEDPKRSGNYLVESIKNVFHENIYTQIVSMSKSGWLGKPAPAQTYRIQELFSEAGVIEEPLLPPVAPDGDLA